MNEDKIKQVPLSNKEIQILIHLIVQSTPALDEQAIVVSMIEKLQFILRLE